MAKRGKPIALIQSIESAGHVVSREARLANLAAQGVITLPTEKPVKKVHLAKVTGTPISRTILEDRR